MSDVVGISIEGFNDANGGVGTRETTYGPQNSLWRTCPVLEVLQDPRLGHVYRDDFYNIDTTNDYAVVADSPGGVSILDSGGGICQINTDGDDNDETYLSNVSEAWHFLDDKPLWFEAYVQADAGATNVIVGLSDTVGANALLDNEAGPAASYDGAVFFVDGNDVWKFETSNASSQVTNDSVGTFAAGTVYRVGFHFDPNDGTTGKVTPYLNGVAGTTHDITLAGLEEMHILLGAKTDGSAEGNLNVDYVQVVQLR
jgi:uncharacterized protein YneR